MFDLEPGESSRWRDSGPRADSATHLLYTYLKTGIESMNWISHNKSNTNLIRIQKGIELNAFVTGFGKFEGKD